MVGGLYNIYDVCNEEFVRVVVLRGFKVWLRSKYMLFRLFMDINMFVASVLVCYMVSGSTSTFAWRMFGYR